MNDPLDRRTIRAFPSAAAPAAAAAIPLDARPGQQGAILWSVGPDGTLTLQSFVANEALIRHALAVLENCLDTRGTRDGLDHADATLHCSKLGVALTADLDDRAARRQRLHAEATRRGSDTF
jgi:hypothetical protein